MVTIGGGSTNGQPKNTISDENHQQLAKRLMGPFGHGTPNKKVKKG